MKSTQIKKALPEARGIIRNFISLAIERLVDFRYRRTRYSDAGGKEEYTVQRSQTRLAGHEAITPVESICFQEPRQASSDTELLKTPFFKSRIDPLKKQKPTSYSLLAARLPAFLVRLISIKLLPE